MALFNLTPASITANINAGLDLLTSLSNIDVVAILDSESFQQLFANGRPAKATVRETSRVMEHPAETGVILADHHIINPVEIDMSMVIPAPYYASVYQQIRNAFINATSLAVQTRTGVYNDMIIAVMPHEEDAQMYDAITMSLKFVQVIYIVPGTVNGTLQNYSPANPANANTVQSGLQAAGALGKQALSAAISVASYASLVRRF